MIDGGRVKRGLYHRLSAYLNIPTFWNLHSIVYTHLLFKIGFNVILPFLAITRSVSFSNMKGDALDYGAICPTIDLFLRLSPVSLPLSRLVSTRFTRAYGKAQILQLRRLRPSAPQLEQFAEALEVCFVEKQEKCEKTGENGFIDIF